MTLFLAGPDGRCVHCGRHQAQHGWDFDRSTSIVCVGSKCQVLDCYGDSVAVRLVRYRGKEYPQLVCIDHKKVKKLTMHRLEPIVRRIVGGFETGRRR